MSLKTFIFKFNFVIYTYTLFLTFPVENIHSGRRENVDFNIVNRNSVTEKLLP